MSEVNAVRTAPLEAPAEAPPERPGGMNGFGFPEPLAAADLLEHLEGNIRSGRTESLAPLPTGFHPLDQFLDGGLRPGDLILVGGAQGVGKTTLTLQMARNLAVGAQATCGYVCYEHDEGFLLQRLLSLESLLGSGTPEADAIPVTRLRELLVEAGRSGSGQAGLEAALATFPAARRALGRVRTFGQRLYLLKASGSASDVPALRKMVRGWKERHGPRVVLFVDYLQKMAVYPPAPDETEKVTQVANALKELALEETVPIVAVVAADRQGLQAQRLRIHHLRGSSSLMYESDVVLILNNKYRIVAKHAITYNPYRARELRNWVICTVEKNRSGHDLVDLEFRTQFAFAALDPRGSVVTDQLIEERIEDQ